ncbi:hypothetical protein AMS68_000525 [Peltaster fructicola]|uniref:N-acetyltransferase domain-containing protein n=1 Tax=Peltaster fructicola TaxID=286661 RepID=A0A6H0XK50_9PEZI|nr:hypothetical protein AMS68_000525 [Peltaster fructicola]
MATQEAQAVHKTKIRYVTYSSDQEATLLPAIRQLISKDLSEPYSIYVYRFFLHGWPNLSHCAMDEDGNLIGVIVCKLEPHRGGPMRGYIAMLATRSDYRGQGIATKLVELATQKMIDQGADEIALETEVDNVPSLRIYEKLGFLRTKRLHRYYLSGTTAFRLILYVKPGIPYMKTTRPEYAPPPEDPANHMHGAMSEDLLVRQAAQLDVEDVYHERADVTGR